MEEAASDPAFKGLLDSASLLRDCSSSERDQEVGAWGEKLVFQYLLDKYEREAGESADGAGRRHVHWVNKDGESGKPYDVVVSGDITALGARDDDQTLFIEVKTTTASTKEVAEISIQELMFATERGSAYSIWRVSDALSGRPNLQVIDHPVQRLKNDEITLLITI